MRLQLWCALAFFGICFQTGADRFGFTGVLALSAQAGLGNLIDRVRYGYVVDFIEPVFINFAIFNIADCAVTLGAVSLIAYLICDLFKKEDKTVA